MRSVDVVVPVLNEVRHIRTLLDEIAAMRDPSLTLDVVIIEGGSTDGTREALDEARSRYPEVRVLANPGANKARGLNMAIAATSGEVIARLDAHASYPPHYLVALTQALDEHEADAVGGVRINAVGTSRIARAIAAVNGSRFGAGNADYRTSTAGEPREVDTVFPGFWRRAVFDRLGGFDERLERAQDREFSARLERSGGRIMLIPGVTMTYFGRERLGANLRWTSDGAAWVFRAARGRRGVLKLRNVIPLLFFAGVVIAGASMPWLPRALQVVAATPVAAYVALALAESARAAIRRRDAILLVLMPPLYVATHAAYAWGSLRGVASLARPARRSMASEAAG